MDYLLVIIMHRQRARSTFFSKLAFVAQGQSICLVNKRSVVRFHIKAPQLLLLRDGFHEHVCDGSLARQ